VAANPAAIGTRTPACIINRLPTWTPDLDPVDAPDAWRPGDVLIAPLCDADGRLVGIAHYLFHAQSWSADACYLQDLFTAEEARGRGVASALIDAVAAEARGRGAVKFYWMTKEGNRTARKLYDRIARFKGFVRYDYPL